MSTSYTTTEIKYIRELSSKLTMRQVAEKLGRTLGGIRQIAHRQKIKFRNSEYRFFNSENVQDVIRLRRQGKTFQQIADETGIAISSCRYLYRRHA